MQINVEVKAMLRLMVGCSLSVGVKHPSRTQDYVFIIIRHLVDMLCRMSSLMRGPVYHLQFLLVPAIAVIPGLQSFRIYYHQFYCLRFEDPETWSAKFPNSYPAGTGFTFRLLLIMVVLRWRYSTTLPEKELTKKLPYN
jgi:hypothetical protein